jgi:hypothetical protein
MWEETIQNESKMVEQELDRQARFWRRRPDGFAINEKENIIYILEFKRVSDIKRVTESGESHGAERSGVIKENIHFCIVFCKKRL